MRDDLSDPVQGVHGSGHAFGCAVVDLSRAGLITQTGSGKAGAQDVGSQPLQGLPVVGFYRLGAVDLKAAAVAPVGDRVLSFTAMTKPFSKPRIGKFGDVEPADTPAASGGHQR